MAAFFTNDDGSVKVKVIDMGGVLTGPEEELHRARVIEAIKTYKWRNGDFLIASYPKNGTHMAWEIMNMLLRGTSEYIREPKEYCMIDLTPVTQCDEWFPSERVLNTHYRLDVLPQEFRGKKTVVVLRNVKDTFVSLYEHLTKLKARIRPGHEETKKLATIPFSQFLRSRLTDPEQYYGTYFDYVEYMWSLRDGPNLLVIFYEDLVKEPVPTIQKVNEFMGTKRSPELVQQIADAMNIEKMREGKAASMDDMKSQIGMFKDAEKGVAAGFYRKGKIGDWKNYFTVADNELVDSLLEEWTAGKEIPFKYE